MSETRPQRRARRRAARKPGRGHARAVRLSQLLLGAATVWVAGVAAVGLGPSDVGAALVLLGAVATMYAIHKYGRLGPEGEREPRAPRAR
ncbi:MAG: hypothetical protein HY744_07975 [Deltaproteobacteria bacterium]|nr:hypothetical protein [Deltaproteobacteria bacterium]